jgi:hypothetical protein
MTWTLAKGHKGPVKGVRASGPQGPDPLCTHYSCVCIFHWGWDSSVSIVAGLWAVQLGSHGSIPSRGKRLFTTPTASRLGLGPTQPSV